MQIRVTKPLTDLQNDNYNKLKEDLYNFIIITNDFPEWKQANFLDNWSSLAVKELSVTLLPTELTEKNYIESVREWKNNLLAERDRVKVDIFAATDIAGIRTAIDSFTYTNMPVKP